MEDLLRTYRRAARLNDWPECLRCLRKLVALPENGIEWQSDLDALETRIMDEIRDQLTGWIEQGRAAALEQALVELSAFTDTPRQRVLLADISRALETYCRTGFLERGRALLENARAAQATRNGPRLIEAIRQYQQLGESIFFSPTTAMSAQYSELFEGYKDAVRAMEQQRQFDEALTELMVEMGKPNPGYRLVHIWRRLQASGEELSAELAQKAGEAVQKIERKRRALRKTAVMAAATAGILLGTGISSLLVRWQRSEAQALMLGQLDAQWETTSPEQYIATMEIVSKRYPFLLHREEMRYRAERLGQFEKQLRGLQAAFVQRLQALQAVLDETGAWDTDVLLQRRHEVDLLAQDALAAFEALGPEINPIRLRTSIENWSQQVPEEWRTAAVRLLAWAEETRPGRADLDRALARWEQFKGDRQGRMDLAFSSLLEQADVTLSSLDLQTAGEEALLAPRQLMERAAGMQGISPQLNKELEAVRKRADEMGSAILRRRQLFQEVEHAEALPGYLAALQNYREAFPSHRLSAWMETVLARADFYRSVLSPATAAQIPGLQAPRAEWAGLLAARARNWPAARTRLMSLGGEKRLVDLREFSLGRWHKGVFNEWVGFLEGDFSAGSYDPRGGAAVSGIRPVVEGKTYFPRSNDVEPDFQFSTYNRAKGDYASQPKLMPHCRFVDHLLGVVKTAEGESFSPDLFLAASAGELAAQEDIPPLLRLRLVHYLVEQLVLVAPEGGRPLWADFLSAASRIGSEVNWLCTKNREVAMAGGHAAEILDRHFVREELARRYAYYVAALRTAATRDPVWAGHAEWVEQEPAPIVRSGLAARELWVFRPDSTGAVWAVAGVLEDSGWRLEMKLEPGEPLFAPNSTATTRELVSLLREEAHLRAGLSLPPVKGWPQTPPVKD